jgi:CRISPR-associated protein (TIGR03984 family)
MHDYDGSAVASVYTFCRDVLIERDSVGTIKDLIHSVCMTVSDFSSLTGDCGVGGGDDNSIVLPAASMWVLAHADHCVQLGALSVVEESLDMEDHSACAPAYLRELRAFTSKEELHLVRTRNGFQGRIRCDAAHGFEGGKEVQVYREDDLMWGKVQLSSAGKALVDADRGVNIQLPHGVSIRPGVRLKYRHVNYVCFGDDGTIQIPDNRLAGVFVDVEG